MLESIQSGVLEYKKLSKEEMEQRGILGRLVGVCADFLNPTRNGRKYPEKLWENVFNDPIMKERIENNCCFGELGHPSDREETDMEKIAVVMDGVPKKDKDGKLRAIFNIVDTPNGRILKSLCDYGSTLGISSRGSGDLETDFDGQESVNPDTYNCEGFDVVLIPAVKEARLQYVTEALDKKRYNKTLREKLTESIEKETEEHQKVVKESLDVLGINLSDNDIDESFDDGSGLILLDEPENDLGITLPDRIILTDNGAYDLKKKGITGYYTWVGFEHNRNNRGMKDKVYDTVYKTIIPALCAKFNVSKKDILVQDFMNSFDMYRVVLPITTNESLKNKADVTDQELTESKFGMFKYTYGVHAYPQGADKILAGAKSLEEAERLGIEQAQSIFENPWMSSKEKYDYLETMYISDDDKGVEVDTHDFDDFVDGLMSELSSKTDFKESLETSTLNEEIYLSKDWRKLKVGDTVKQKIVSFDGTQVWDCIVKEVYPDHIIMSPTEENFTDINFWIDDDVVDSPLDLTEDTLTPEEKMDMWHEGKRKENIKACSDAKLNAYRKICLSKGYYIEAGQLEDELYRRGIDFSNKNTTSTKPSCSMKDGELYILFDNSGRDFISKYTKIDSIPRDLIGGKEYFVVKKSDPFANALASDLIKILDEGLIVEQLTESFINNTADDNGVMVEELQKSLDLNRKLDKKIVDLQEKLSVSYAKEINLQEELEKYKSKVIKLSRRLAEEKVINEKLTAVQDKKVIAEENCKKLSESIKVKTAKITSLKESVEKRDEQVASLNEQVQQLMSALDERNSQFESLTDKYETLNKDYQQFKENYSKKIDQQNALVEKYRGVAIKSVNKYIDTQATRLGISSAEIKNRLPESYSFSDIDRICEDLQEYKLNISNLPFSTSGRLNEGMRFKANNVSQNTLVPVEDELDDLTLRLAGLD